MKTLLKGFISLLLILGIAAGWLYRDMRVQLEQPLNLDAETDFVIEPGQSLQSVLARMATNGWLPGPRSALYLRLRARLEPQSAVIQAGEYPLKPGMTAPMAIALFVSGRTRVQSVRILEGWTFAQALDAIRSHPKLRATDDGADALRVMTALGAADVPAEGQLFPDTYQFSAGTTDLAVLRQAHQAMQNALAQVWAQRDADLPYESPLQALTMASIIEKETGAAQERSRIAGVFVRRLRLGMRLQTDPTVIYGLGAAFDGNLRRVDLQTDTPYNTYTRSGLPPTPICLPGRAALDAAVHPAAGDSLFFVARGDGTHEFSATLAEHEAAVQRFQLGAPTNDDCDLNPECQNE